MKAALTVPGARARWSTAFARTCRHANKCVNEAVETCERLMRPQNATSVHKHPPVRARKSRWAGIAGPFAAFLYVCAQSGMAGLSKCARA